MIKKVFDFISNKVSIESSRHLVRLIHSHLKKNTAIANSKGNAGNVCKTHAHGLHVGVGILNHKLRPLSLKACIVKFVRVFFFLEVKGLLLRRHF